MESLKNKLERMVAQPPEDVDGVTEEAGKLLLDIIRLEGRADRLLSMTGAGPPGVQTLQGMPLQEAARRVLERAREPLHVRELAARVKAGGWRHRRTGGNPDQLAHQLAARLPRYPVFDRVRPNTFGLAEWAETARPAVSGPRPLFASADQGLADWIGEHPEAPFERAWPSS